MKKVYNHGACCFMIVIVLRLFLTVGYSAVCDCSIFWSYSLTFYCNRMASVPMQIISQNTVDWVIVKHILCVSEKKKALEPIPSPCNKFINLSFWHKCISSPEPKANG